MAMRLRLNVEESRIGPRACSADQIARAGCCNAYSRIWRGRMPLVLPSSPARRTEAVSRAWSSQVIFVEMWNLTPGVGTARCTLSVGFTFTHMTAPVRVLVTGAPSSRQDAP
jgi:hypothetical protein